MQVLCLAFSATDMAGLLSVRIVSILVHRMHTHASVLLCSKGTLQIESGSSRFINPLDEDRC